MKELRDKEVKLLEKEKDFLDCSYGSYLENNYGSIYSFQFYEFKRDHKTRNLTP